jgi:CelD/BcsL family acetyltransferase involved in cellulose biosynthesis
MFNNDAAVIDQLTDPAEIERLAGEWDDLATRTGASPFLRPGWITAWWDAFGSGSPVLFTAWRNGRLSGLLPMERRGGVLASASNWHTPDYGCLAEDDESRAAIFEWVIRERRRRVDLAFLPADGADSEAFAEAASGCILERRVLLRSPFVQIAGDWDAYWSGLSKNLRGTIKRCRNRLSDIGETSVRVHQDGADLESLLTTAFELEASGWKGDEGTAISDRPETARFYRRVAAWAAERGMLRLAVLSAGERIVAFNYAISDNGCEHLLKLGHDAQLNRVGPGTVLTAEVLQAAFERGLDRYDFGGGDDAYKLRWTPEVRCSSRMQAFAPTAAGNADRAVQVYGRRAVIGARGLAVAGRRRIGR